MAAPNIVNVTTIYGKSANLVLTTGWQTLITNAGGSGTVIKLNALYVGNNSATPVTLYGANGGGIYLYSMSIPAYSCMDLINKPIYIEEGNILQFYASAVGPNVLGSYEVIS